MRRWMTPLGLKWWSHIEVELLRTPKTDNGPTAYAPKVVKDSWTTAMETVCDPYYLTARVSVYLPVTAPLSDDDLEITFLHELMHVMLSPIHTKTTSKEEEHVATKLAQAFVWVREAGKR